MVKCMEQNGYCICQYPVLSEGCGFISGFCGTLAIIGYNRWYSETCVLFLWTDIEFFTRIPIHFSNRIFVRSQRSNNFYNFTIKFVWFVLKIYIYYIYILKETAGKNDSSVGKLIILLNIVFLNAEHCVTLDTSNNRSYVACF